MLDVHTAKVVVLWVPDLASEYSRVQSSGSSINVLPLSPALVTSFGNLSCPCCWRHPQPCCRSCCRCCCSCESLHCTCLFGPELGCPDPAPLLPVQRRDVTRAGAVSLWPELGAEWSQWLIEAAPGQLVPSGANLVNLPVTIAVVGRLQPLGTCGGQLSASQQCSNATAWAGRSGEWVLEPAGGPNLYYIRFNVCENSCPRTVVCSAVQSLPCTTLTQSTHVFLDCRGVPAA